METTDLNTEQRSPRRRTERAVFLRVTRDAWVSAATQDATRSTAISVAPC
jgi:hypothetical protein